MVKEASLRERRSYTPEQWLEIIELWRTSGLSKKEYCQKKGITYSVFKRWFKKVADTGLKKESACVKEVEDKFIPVYLGAEGASALLKPQLEVRLASGHYLNLQGPFEWEQVGVFLKALLVG